MKRSNLSRLLQSPVFMTLVRISPRMIAFYLLWIVTNMYFLANREDTKTIRNNINEVFGRRCNREEIDILLRLTLKGIFYHYFEKLLLACATNRHWRDYSLERIRISGKKLLDRFLAGNKGLILVTAHFGGVEFLPGFLTLLGYPVAIVAKFKTQRLRERCEDKAKSVGATIIDANERNSFFMAVSALREGKILITQCDEVECWKAHPTRTMLLFETSFQVDRTVTILQKRSGAPVVFGYMRRERKGRYLVEIEDLRGPGGAFPERLEEPILKKLENLVYTFPDQWYIWKNFQLMKATWQEDIAVEDRQSRDLPLTPAPIAVLRSSQSLSKPHGQYCRQGSV